jgi:hypothetical protein
MKKTHSKSITEWQKLAVSTPDASLPHLEYERQYKLVEKAKENVKLYEQYKQILELKSLTALKKYLKKHKLNGAICLYGDCQNLRWTHTGKWTEDYKGNHLDDDVDDTEIWCEDHGSDYVLYEFDDILKTDIAEFKEVLKLLEPYRGN